MTGIFKCGSTLFAVSIVCVAMMGCSSAGSDEAQNGDEGASTDTANEELSGCYQIRGGCYAVTNGFTYLTSYDTGQGIISGVGAGQTVSLVTLSSPVNTVCPHNDHYYVYWNGRYGWIPAGRLGGASCW